MSRLIRNAALEINSLVHYSQSVGIYKYAQEFLPKNHSAELTTLSISLARSLSHTHMSFVITGATGGLGGGVLKHLSKQLPKGSIVATSRDPSRVPSELSALAPFRAADFSDPASLDAAFAGASKVLLVSSPTFDVPVRIKQHENAIEACKRAGVKRIYYTSLAFGGYTSTSKMGVMAAHLATEEYLKTAGVPYTIVREGAYADAFPFFISWYPDTTEIKLSGDGPIVWTSRDELAEGTAKLMLEDGYENELVLLTGPEPLTLRETTQVVAEALGKEITFEEVTEDQYVDQFNKTGKSAGLARAWAGTFRGLRQGEGETVDPLLEKLLGRRPKSGREWITKTLQENPGYRWHQNEKYHRS